MNYCVRVPLLAIRDEAPNPPTFISIVPGSVITIGDVQHSGLVDVLHDGEIFAAFMRDIEARADVTKRKPLRLSHRLGN